MVESVVVLVDEENDFICAHWSETDQCLLFRAGEKNISTTVSSFTLRDKDERADGNKNTFAYLEQGQTELYHEIHGLLI